MVIVDNTGINLIIALPFVAPIPSFARERSEEGVIDN